MTNDDNDERGAEPLSPEQAASQLRNLYDRVSVVKTRGDTYVEVDVENDPAYDLFLRSDIPEGWMFGSVNVGAGTVHLAPCE